MIFWRKLFGRHPKGTKEDHAKPVEKIPEPTPSLPGESVPDKPSPVPVASSIDPKTAEPSSEDISLDHKLYAAIKERKVDEVRALLDRGADANAMVRSAPVIHFALASSFASDSEEEACLQIIDLLLKSGANVDAPCPDGYGSERGSFTPLMNAIQMERPKTVQRLIQQGANTSIRTSGGLTAFQLCLAGTGNSETRYQAIKKLLSETTQDGKAWLQSTQGKEWVLVHTVDKTFPLPATPYDITTLLQDVFSSEDGEQLQQVVQWVEAGGDLQWRTPNGWTLLHLAAQRGNNKMIRFLLARGADIESRDKKNGTPLMLACNTGFMVRLSLSTVTLLLDSGANPNAEDLDGNIPLRLIRRSGTAEAKAIAALLETGGAERIPGKTATCSECGAPESSRMRDRGVQVTFDGAFAAFSCPKCEKAEQLPIEAIDKTKGVQVCCPSCRHIAFIPPTVWCRTCGIGLSTGWQSAIVQQG